MSNKLLTAVWDRAPYYGGALLVYLALADQASDEGMCWPSVPTIAAKARMNVRNCQKHLAQLVADGAIARRPRRGHSTIYVVYAPEFWENPPQDDAPPVTAESQRGVAGDTPKRKKAASGVAGDTPLVSQETPPPVAGDTPPLSQETPRSPMEPLMIPQLNRGPSPQKNVKPDPDPEPLRWATVTYWCINAPKGKAAMAPFLAKSKGEYRREDIIAAWNSTHPERLWKMQKDRGGLTTRPGIEPLHAS